MPIPFLPPDDDLTAFPDAERALKEPNGLLMAGANLSPRRLVSAYQQGIFPWYEEGEPILWWSPDPRCIIWPERIHIHRSLRKVLRRGEYQITRNLAFREVMTLCGASRSGSSGTWVTRDMIDAYCRLRDFGITQSFEAWFDGQLVGGLYGLAIGRVFVGESMFTRRTDASKVALVSLARCGDYDLIDCQLETSHLRSMGAETIARREYLQLLRRYGELDKPVFVPSRLQAESMPHLSTIDDESYELPTELPITGVVR